MYAKIEAEPTSLAACEDKTNVCICLLEMIDKEKYKCAQRAKKRAAMAVAFTHFLERKLVSRFQSVAAALVFCCFFFFLHIDCKIKIIWRL